MPAFNINGMLTNNKTMTAALYANQHENRATDADDTEILYYSNGAPTSSTALTFDGSALNVNGDLNASRNVIFGNRTGTVLNNGIQFVTQGQGTVFMDVHTLPGGTNDFDYRMIFGGGVTGDFGGGACNFQGKESNFFSSLRTTRIGGGLAPAWFMDYRSSPANVGVNTVTTISFTAGLFTTAPVVVVTANTPTGVTSGPSVHVEEVTATNFKVEYFGTVAAGTSFNWIAMGL